MLDLGTQAGVISNLLETRDRQLAQRDSTIAKLEQRITQKLVDNSQLSQLSKELAIQYPKIKTFTLSNSVLYQPSTNKTDTTTIFYVEWTEKEDAQRLQQLEEWIKVKTNSQKVKIVEMR